MKVTTKQIQQQRLHSDGRMTEEEPIEVTVVHYSFLERLAIRLDYLANVKFNKSIKAMTEECGYRIGTVLSFNESGVNIAVNLTNVYGKAHEISNSEFNSVEGFATALEKCLKYIENGGTKWQP